MTETIHPALLILAGGACVWVPYLIFCLFRKD